MLQRRDAGPHPWNREIGGPATDPVPPEIPDAPHALRPSISMRMDLDRQWHQLLRVLNPDSRDKVYRAEIAYILRNNRFHLIVTHSDGEVEVIPSCAG